MKLRIAAILILLAAFAGSTLGQGPAPPRPKAGKVEILKSSDVKPGMKGYAWTVFQGMKPEPMPVEIIGLWKSPRGPKQHIILAKLGGKAQRTNVAGGMSGSPVYIDGKLIGAIALRLSVFSPDAICGITPIEQMLEVSDFDSSRPSDARTPDKVLARNQLTVPSELLAQAVAAGGSPSLAVNNPVLVPIETPITFSGFHENVLREFGPLFQQLGLVTVQGGASGGLHDPRPAPGWQSALQPGEAVAGVLVSGDMTIGGLGTVTYNDGKRILAFGHPFFNLGPVDMPMSKGEVLMVLSSSFQPNKFANITESVGALRQDRRSGMMGLLGETAEMIPVSVRVRSFAEDDSIRNEKQFRYNVFVQQKWTPNLMMMTLFNTLSGINDFGQENTYRLRGKVEFDDGPSVSLSNMQAPGEMPMPAPMLLAGWVGDKFNRLFLNTVKAPRLKRVDVTVDLLPQRRIATIESAWAENSEVEAGGEVPVRVFLRPYRGQRLEREFRVKVPAGIPNGRHRILLSDAATLNRMQTAAGRMNRFIDLQQTISLINQERANNKLYVSLVEARPTVYYGDKALTSLPASVLNVMRAGRTASRPFVTSRETASEQAAIPFDYVIKGSYSLRITVK
jgi:hypothetical protein